MKGSRPLTRLQVKEVLRVTASIREKTLLTVGFCTGFRISELLSLKLSDVSTGGAIHSHVTVKAANTKTKTSRSVMLNSDAKKALTLLLEWLKSKGFTDKSTPLFISRKRAATGENKAINRQQAHEIVKALFAKIGEFGNVSTHTLRKTFAARVYEQTGKLELVQIALGHKSINSTISYLAFGNDDVDNAIMGIM
ncbi:MAG: tyrosine-type recombinase/integrase [Methylococcaceae bacterium]